MNIGTTSVHCIMGLKLVDEWRRKSLAFCKILFKLRIILGCLLQFNFIDFYSFFITVEIRRWFDCLIRWMAWIRLRHASLSLSGFHGRYLVTWRLMCLLVQGYFHICFCSEIWNLFFLLFLLQFNQLYWASLIVNSSGVYTFVQKFWWCSYQNSIRKRQLVKVHSGRSISMRCVYGDEVSMNKICC
jgi:hypothetical protein